MEAPLATPAGVAPIPHGRRFGPLVQRVVAVTRRHLAMDVAFLVQVEDDQQIVRVLDGDADSFALSIDARHSTKDTYCGLLLDGLIPELIADTRTVEAVRTFPATDRLHIGSYVGVPVQLSDGTVFGVLACVSHSVSPWLGAADLLVMHTAADILAGELEDERESWRRHCLDLAESRRLSADAPLSIAVQPIMSLQSAEVVGAEALARFPDAAAPPDVVFRRAWATGYGVELELRAVRSALKQLPAFPGNAFLTLNVSPQLPLDDHFAGLLDQVDMSRVVIELTEHSRMGELPLLSRRLETLRREGLRLAVDDAGAGYSGLNRILELAPDFIKLDAALVRGIETDPRRAALVASLVEFGERIGADVVAEGIETQAQLAVLCEVGVPLGQGYLLGRPVPADEL